MTSKLVIQGGMFMHPTKGFRVNSPGQDVEVKEEHKLERLRRRPRSEMATVVEGMTNWQRHQFTKAKATIRREGKRLQADALLAMAKTFSELAK